MYVYQLLSAKAWQQQEEAYQLASESGQGYLPKPKRIKHFYDTGYDDIIKLLVAEPESCKNFYQVLQQQGLPEQSYYHKIPNKVSEVLKTALFTETAILIELPPQSGHYAESSTSQFSNVPLPVIKKEPYYEPDNSWLVVDLVNHKPELMDIRDGGDSRQTITKVQTSPNEIFLKHGDTFSVSEVLPKVHLLIGGNQGDSDLTLRGEKPLRVKKLAQAWLDELTTLIRSGNSPFTAQQDEALASAINYGFSPQHYSPIKKLDDKSPFRPDERIGALFYQVVLVLNQTSFITATERIGDLGYDESEGAITDPVLLKQAIKALHDLRHSEGYDKADYAYKSDTLAKIAREYLSKPLVLDGTGDDNDYETKLKQQINHDIQSDELTDIDRLYFNAIKLLKHLRQPGLIKHVQTRREYRLKATKLNYQYIELQPRDTIKLQLHANFKYKITANNHNYHFIGRFNADGHLNIKIPAKWSNEKEWNIHAEAVEDDFVTKLFPKLVNPTWTAQDKNNIVTGLAGGGIIGGITGYLYGDQIKETVIENLPRITGAMQVAGGAMSLYVAGVIGASGVGTPLAAVIGFVALDNIQAGMRSMYTNEYTPTYGSELIEWSGLVPKGYGELAYALVDFSAIGKAGTLLKTITQSSNIVKFKTVNALKSEQPLKPTDIIVSVEKISLNQKNIIELKEFNAGSIRNVNPGYPEVGRVYNCVNCSIATDLTLANRPTSALPSYSSKGVPLSVLEKHYGKKFINIISSENIEQKMLEAGSGARGIIYGSYGENQVGHVFNVINQNGKIRFLDGQTGKPVELSQFKSFLLLRTN